MFAGTEIDERFVVEDEEENISMHGVFLHVLADTLGSVGVIISSILIDMFGWTISDPITSIFISVLIFGSVVPLLQNSTGVLLQRVPSHATRSRIARAKRNLSSIPGVIAFDKLHLWKQDESTSVGTVHIYVDTDAVEQTIRGHAEKVMKTMLGLSLVTIQVEKDNPRFQ